MTCNLCAMCFVRALSTTSMTVKFACAFAAFCAIVRSNIVIILCILLYLIYMRLVKLIER